MVQIRIRDQESCQPWIWDPGWKKWDLSSVADPNPDPYVFGPLGSGSISQRHGSAGLDPDPHQNVMDPQHWIWDPGYAMFIPDPGSCIRNVFLGPQH
jgi:hypothetical protein